MYFNTNLQKLNSEVGDIAELVRLGVICSGWFGPRRSSGGGLLAFHAQSPEFDPQLHMNQLQWYLPIILALRW